ncbi:hypothetical protein QTP70_024803, partial [Hemibagrus guttatus]
KDYAFVWTGECQKVFYTLRQALAEALVLVPPGTALPFVLDTDASNFGVGALLLQAGPDGEQVFAYFSRVFNKSERRYCVTRRELLAVVMAVRHFKYYLGSVPFMIRTDHVVFQWLMSFKEPEGQVAQGLEELQSYNFTVVHRAGSNHANANALSHCPCAAEGCHHCEKRETHERELCQESEPAQPACGALSVVDAPEWRAQQKQDGDLRTVQYWLEAPQRPGWGDIAGYSLITKELWSKFDILQLSDGVLQRAWKESATGEARWQVLVPKALRELVREQRGWPFRIKGRDFQVGESVWVYSPWEKKGRSPKLDCHWF